MNKIAFYCEIHFATACSLSHGPLTFCLIPQWFFGIHGHSHNGVRLLIVILLISIYLGLELTSKVPWSLRFFFLLISCKELSNEVSISGFKPLKTRYFEECETCPQKVDPKVIDKEAPVLCCQIGLCPFKDISVEANTVSSVRML